jgi:hypothetical protein
MSMFDSIKDGLLVAGFTIVGKFVAKIALALGGSFVVANYVLTPVYDAIMGALIAAGNGGSLAQWLALARIPDIISVLFAGMGVASAQKLVFKKLTS